MFLLSVHSRRTPLEPGHKLLITLRYMSTGDAYRSMRFNFRVPHNSISILVREVSEAIYQEYKEQVWTRPHTPEEWKEVEQGFANRWNFHHCVGALDGKHVAIQKPKNSGSRYYNYKNFFSVILMAAVDANYSFIWCSLGHPGRMSDAGIFKM